MGKCSGGEGIPTFAPLKAGPSHKWPARCFESIPERLTGFRPHTPVTEIIGQVALDMRRRLKLDQPADEELAAGSAVLFPILHRA